MVAGIIFIVLSFALLICAGIHFADIINKEYETTKATVFRFIWCFVLGIFDFIWGMYLLTPNQLYMITVNRNDGTSIEVETKNYNVEDTYIKIKQNDSYIYIYDVKDVKVTEKDK